MATPLPMPMEFEHYCLKCARFAEELKCKFNLKQMLDGLSLGAWSAGMKVLGGRLDEFHDQGDAKWIVIRGQ
jgi:hypothetical protein